MKLRVYVILLFVMCSVIGRAQWHNVNFDAKTTAAMTATYSQVGLLEASITSLTTQIRNDYAKAELALAGIWGVKLADRNALKRAGLFDSEQENYYYQYIYNLVSRYIVPKMMNVSILFLKNPQDILYWGPYLVKITSDLNILCATFQQVVTNSSLNFKDIYIPVLQEWLKPYLTLVNTGMNIYGEIDSLVKAIKNVDIEKVKEDFSSTGNILAKLPTAGWEEVKSMFTFGDDYFSGNVIVDAMNLSRKYREHYNKISSPENLYSTLLGRIHTDETGLLDIFELKQMSFNDFLTRWKKDDPDRHYKQRYYIYWQSAGEEVMCDYTPDYTKLWLWNTNRQSPWALEDWDIFEARFGSRGLGGFPDRFDDGRTLEEQARKASENLSGWSQEKVNNLNMSQKEYTYKIFYDILDYRYGPGSHDNLNPNLPNEGHGDYDRAVGYKIKVTRTWKESGEVFEEFFDSQTMDKTIFDQHMQQKLAYYREKDAAERESSGSGLARTFYIGSDEPTYYYITDAEKMKGVASVNFIRKCQDGASLGEGSTSWKVNEDHDVSQPTDYSRELAMQTSVNAKSSEQVLKESREIIAQKENDINILTSELSSLKSRMTSVNGKLMLNPNDQSLLKERASLEAEISAKETVLKTKKDELTRLKAAYQQQQDDFASDVNQDAYGKSRIPGIMNWLVTSYEGEWIDEGHWEGNTYVRQMRIPTIMNSIATFRATLSLSRGESWFIIRYHRSILTIDWKLSSSYSSEDIVETMKFNSDVSDADKASQVNRRQQELMAEAPTCTIEIQENVTAGKAGDDSYDGQHLLWMSNRLQIARDVAHKLTHLYADLMTVEKWCKSRQTIIGMFTQPFVSAIEKGRQGVIGNAALRRWQESLEKSIRQGTEVKE